MKAQMNWPNMIYILLVFHKGRVSITSFLGRAYVSSVNNTKNNCCKKQNPKLYVLWIEILVCSWTMMNSFWSSFTLNQMHELSNVLCFLASIFSNEVKNIWLHNFPFSVFMSFLHIADRKDTNGIIKTYDTHNCYCDSSISYAICGTYFYFCFISAKFSICTTPSWQ